MAWNVFGKNTTSDVEYSPADISANPGVIHWMPAVFDCNYFYTTGTNRYKNLPVGHNDQALTASPFTDDVNGNYSLNSVAGAGLLLRTPTCLARVADGINSSLMVGGPTFAIPTAGAAATAFSLWRELANEPDAIQIPDSVPTVYIDAGCEALNRRIRYYWKTDSTSIVLLNGVQEYSLPADLIELRWVEWNGKPLTKGSIDEWRKRGDDWRNEPVGEPRES